MAESSRSAEKEVLLGDNKKEEEGPSGKKQKPDDDLHIGEIEHGVYFSVIVAAFGGITQDVSQGDPIKIHPLVMLILCLPLFIAQLSIIVMLRMDQDLETLVYEVNATTVGNPWRQMIGVESPPELRGSHLDLSSLTGVTLLKSKVLMVVILQLIFFSKLQNGLRFLVFLLNPTTWTDVVRADKSEVKLHIGTVSLGNLYNALLIAPITWLACLMKLLVSYNVLVDSMSIILASTGVKQAIFNSLAVSFIGELNTFYFYFISKVFHFNDFDKFKFRKATATLRDKLAESTVWHRVEECVDADKTLCGCFKLRYLHRGNGANRLEWCFVGFLMFFVYFRQFGVMMDALDENVLPMSRDVCTFYHWQMGHGGQNAWDLLGSKVFRASEQVLVIDAAPAIKVRGHKFCNPDHKYNRRYDMVTTTRHLMHKYPRLWTTSMTSTAVCLIVPQVFFALNSQIRSVFDGGESESPREDTGEPKESP